MSWLNKLLPGRSVQLWPIESLMSDTVILCEGESASIEYLIRPHLQAQGRDAVILDQRRVAPENPVRFGCRNVIICRYLPKVWIQPLRDFRSQGGRITYFMDDDLMDSLALAGLPSAYRKKIKSFATSHFHLLTELCHEFWVGSAFLAAKYWQWAPLVLTPRTVLEAGRDTEFTTICYHGTSSHQAELKWLAPILSGVGREYGNLVFELFGDNNINKLYRDLPGATILHPMSWSNYLRYTRAVKRDIALAPLLPDAFNKGRGPTKFFDYTRMGAVGIYTNVDPYRDFVRHEIDGILLPNEPGEWISAVDALVHDPGRRQAMAMAAAERVRAVHPKLSHR